MRKKQYLNINVYDAYINRLKYIFNNNEKIIIQISGGKDSSIGSQILYNYAKSINRQKDLIFVFLDYEVQTKYTIEHIEDLFKNVFIDSKKYWLALPNSVPSITNFDNIWIPWEMSKKKVWAREFPKENKLSKINVIDEKDAINMWQYEPGEQDYIVQKDFNIFLNDLYGNIKMTTIVFIRSDESLNRTRTILNNNHNQDKYHKWIYCVSNSLTRSYPLYDWTNDDIWIAASKYNLKYAKLYDLMYQAGVPISKIRTASIFLPEGATTLQLYQAIDPEMWSKAIMRMSGVSFAGRFNTLILNKHNNIISEPPNNMSWQEFVYFLLKTMPKDYQKNYNRIISTSQKFWKENGAVLDDNIIKKLQKYNIKYHNHGKIKKNSNKNVISFDEYADSYPDDIYKQLPNWKRIARSLLLNDKYGLTLGFDVPKSVYEKQKIAQKMFKQNI